MLVRSYWYQIREIEPNLVDLILTILVCFHTPWIGGLPSNIEIFKENIDLSKVFTKV